MGLFSTLMTAPFDAETITLLYVRFKRFAIS